MVSESWAVIPEVSLVFIVELHGGNTGRYNSL